MLLPSACHSHISLGTLVRVGAQCWVPLLVCWWLCSSPTEVPAWAVGEGLACWRFAESPLCWMWCTCGEQTLRIPSVCFSLGRCLFWCLCSATLWTCVYHFNPADVCLGVCVLLRCEHVCTTSIQQMSVLVFVVFCYIVNMCVPLQSSRCLSWCLWCSATLWTCVYHFNPADVCLGVCGLLLRCEHACTTSIQQMSVLVFVVFCYIVNMCVPLQSSRCLSWCLWCSATLWTCVYHFNPADVCLGVYGVLLRCEHVCTTSIQQMSVLVFVVFCYIVNMCVPLQFRRCLSWCLWCSATLWTCVYHFSSGDVCLGVYGVLLHCEHVCTTSVQEMSVLVFVVFCYIVNMCVPLQFRRCLSWCLWCSATLSTSQICFP